MLRTVNVLHCVRERPARFVAEVESASHKDAGVQGKDSSGVANRGQKGLAKLSVSGNGSTSATQQILGLIRWL